MARKILLADDSVTAQNMGRKILADAGYDVITVNNGSAALKKIAELRPELIILDVYMPGYSGLEVCQRLKDAGETARIPVLLTVGKLEPFKPEEAKRVRAEGYIVKPFEASELLSAVSKLEDKIVPRAEAGKPGRLGRAVAVVEEGGRSGDEPEAEGSWKDRISFPAKKKVAEESSDNADLYNTVNRDLKTVVQRGEQTAPVTQDRRVKSISAIAKPEEKLVNMGALATPGLPKDVTAEEIAALAAAAAQVQGTKLEAETAAKLPAEEKVANEPLVSQPVVSKPEVKDTAFKQIRTDATVVPPDAVQEAVAAQPAQETPVQGTKAPATPTEDEVSEAIACLEREQAHGAEQLWNVGSGDAQQSSEKEDLPVTMVGAGDSRGVESPRWTAVPVALDPQEAALSLEREMQTAFRAFTAAAAAQAGPATVVEELQQPAVSTVATEAAPVDLAAIVAPAELKAEPTPAVAISKPVCEEAPRTESNEFAVAAVEAIADHSEQPDFSAVEHLQQTSTPAENVIGQVAIPEQGVGPVEAPVTAATAPEETQVPQTAQEAVTISVGIHEPAPAIIGETVEAELISAEPIIQAPAPATLSAEILASEISPSEQALAEPSVPEKSASEPEGSSDLVSDAMLASEVGFTDTVAAEIGGGVASKAVAAEAPTSLVEETPANENVQAAKPVTQEQENVPQEDEKELVETTAAAWASWRQIRDSVPGSRNDASVSSEHLQDRALPANALAVAAGAESSPSEVSMKAATDVHSQTVASIVDSLLAELRPRIVEEISRKLAAEKK